MLRKGILATSSAYFVLLAGLALMLYRASPAPRSQDILGLGIGSYKSEGGIVYISGRRLLCTPMPESGPFTTSSSCKIQIAGKTLEIHGRHTKSSPLGGRCEVFYDNQQWPCSTGSRHDHVYRFAYIEPPLGLSKTQLDALRIRYFFENLPEAAYFPAGVLMVTATTTIAVILITATVLWPERHTKALYVLFLAVVGGITFVGTFLGAVRLTTGFWD